MRFKIDENLPAECAALLREAGFSADTVVDEGLLGATDTSLIERCLSERRVLITLDLDFANVQAYPPEIHDGIVVFRAKSQDKSVILSQLRRLVRVLDEKSPRGELWIVEQDRIRIRGG